MSAARRVLPSPQLPAHLAAAIIMVTSSSNPSFKQNRIVAAILRPYNHKPNTSSICFLAVFDSYPIFSELFITSTTYTMASVARKDLLKKVYNMVPPMLESFHKGNFPPKQLVEVTLTRFSRPARSCGCYRWKRGLHRRTILLCYGICKAWLRYGTCSLPDLSQQRG